MNHEWRKSSFSAMNNSCVELADAAERCLMRDSKHPGAGHLTLDRGAVADLIAAARQGALDQLA